MYSNISHDVCISHIRFLHKHGFSPYKPGAGGAQFARLLIMAEPSFSGMTPDSMLSKMWLTASCRLTEAERQKYVPRLAEKGLNGVCCFVWQNDKKTKDY